MDRFRRGSKQKNSPPKPQPIHEDTKFTPNKFAEHILQKQINLTKKYEETSQKLREMEAAFNLISDKYQKLLKQKNGVQELLTKQNTSYKNLLIQMQEKTEENLKNIHNKFKEQIQQIIRQKEQELKFVQSQKQQLQTVLQQLQGIGNALQEKLNLTTNSLTEANKKNENYQQQVSTLNEKIDAMQEQHKSQVTNSQQMINQLKQKQIEIQRQWRDKLDEKMDKKQAQIKSIQKQHKEQINKIQQQRELQRKQQNQEIKAMQQEYKQEINKFHEERQVEREQRKEELKKITDSFQNQVERLNQTIKGKQEAINVMNQKSNEEKDKFNQQINAHQQQIIALTSEKTRLFEEVDELNTENAELNILLKQKIQIFEQEKSGLQAVIIKLKDDVGFGQVSFLKERQRNISKFQDLQRSIIQFKQQLNEKNSQNQILTEKCKNLQHILNENSFELEAYKQQFFKVCRDSSLQLQTCKENFFNLSRERDTLRGKLQEISFENQGLRHLKNHEWGSNDKMRNWGNEEMRNDCKKNIDDGTRNWRDSFYLNLHRNRRR